MYFSRLPEWIQRLLAEDTLPVRELAKRVDELQRKVPPPATVAAVPTPGAEIAAVEQRRPHKKAWSHKKPEGRKRRCSSGSGSRSTTSEGGLEACCWTTATGSR